MDRIQLIESKYAETYDEFVENLTDYEMYWYESAEEFLEEADTDDGLDNAIYYQWYLAGMQYVLFLMKDYEQI